MICVGRLGGAGERPESFVLSTVSVTMHIVIHFLIQDSEEFDVQSSQSDGRATRTLA